MTYAEFKARTRFSKEELIAFAYGRLVENPPEDFSRLPAPPFLMVDRLETLESNGTRGRVIGEKDIRMDEWYFQCHFLGDPVQPGCLELDAVWQLLGFYCVWKGGRGRGRALGCREVRFEGQVRPHNTVLRYDIGVRRHQVFPEREASIAIADADIFIDGDRICSVKGATSGLFTGIAYADYPERSPRSRGGILPRN